MREVLRSRRLWATVAGLAVVTALAFGTATLETEANAAPRCLCPSVYAPVICSNGKTYSNLCVANCMRAKNYVPVIILPPPI